MSCSRLLIVGAGGHGKVVADAAQESGRWDEIAFLDDRWPDITEVCGLNVIGATMALGTLHERFPDTFIAIGENSLRMRFLVQVETQGYVVPTIIHPRSYVSRRAKIGAGTVVLAQAVVNVDASLGRGVIVNSGAIVEHDCSLADGVHLSPGAHLGGRVAVGELSWVGIGAAVRDKLTLGAQVIIGAGSTVVKNIPDGALVYGQAAYIRNAVF